MADLLSMAFLGQKLAQDSPTCAPEPDSALRSAAGLACRWGACLSHAPQTYSARDLGGVNRAPHISFVAQSCAQQHSQLHASLDHGQLLLLTPLLCAHCLHHAPLGYGLYSAADDQPSARGNDGKCRQLWEVCVGVPWQWWWGGG